MVRTVLAAALTLVSATAFAQDTRTVCVYDPMGTNGPAYANAQAMAVEAAGQGVKITLRADVEEKTAAEDLVAGKCDAALLTGVMTRRFGLATSTLEAIGALPEYAWLKSTLGYLANPKLASKMVAGDYETAGFYPGGAIYLFTQNKAWRHTKDLAGKTIEIIGDDAAATTMAREVGMSTKTASTATFGPMYNSNSVDAAYAPPTAYEPLELYRGIGDDGGIIDFPLSQLTLQVVIRRDRFPEGFGQWARTYSYQQFDKVMRQVEEAETKIAKHKLEIPAADKPGYEDKFLQVRLTLRERGVYDATLLKLMRRVRCAADGTRAECADPKE